MTYNAARLDRILARLDAFFAVVEVARQAYSTGGVDGARSEIKQVFDAYDNLKIPEPK